MSDAPAAPTESVDLESPPPPPEELVLAAEFPPATREQWGKLVAGVLDKSGARGLTPETAAQKLTVTIGGIPIAGIYGADDDVPDPGLPGSAPFVRGRVPQGTLGGWDVRAYFANPSPGDTREQVLLDLENGVSSLWLSVGDSGFPIDALGDVLAEVLLDLAPVVLDAGADAIPAARTFLEMAVARGVPIASLTGNLGLDPLGHAARTGTAVQLDDAAAFAAQFSLDWGGSAGSQLRSIVVDALPFHDAGATEAQELGLSIAAGVAYLRALAAAGLSPEAAAGQLEFRYAATDDQFLTIAKLRAARKLWSRIAAACGVPEAQQGQLQHAVTSWPMMTVRDPYVNMLRTTVAAFAAGVGGADSVTVLPFDAAIGLPEVLGRRVARNTQALLIDESHIAAVIDPAGGSWYVESLTDSLAKAGWDEFQAIEAAGGIAQALADGLVAEQLSRSRIERDHKIDVREDAITGVSEFPQLDEKLVAREPAPHLPSGGLPRIRWSERHEAMRGRADRFTVETGHEPAVLLVPLESTRAASARLSFAADLLRPAGIAPETLELTGESATESDLAEALKRHATTIAVLCGTDDAYAASAANVADALRKAGATKVLLAGQAKAAPDAVIDTFLFRGCDAVAAQERVLTELGVKR
jgi:methylmalonyl-CoA mutase